MSWHRPRVQLTSYRLRLSVSRRPLPKNNNNNNNNKKKNLKKTLKVDDYLYLCRTCMLDVVAQLELGTIARAYISSGQSATVVARQTSVVIGNC